jgi:hypothetical protein
MTDGPHKSLRQKRPWKVLAQKAANENFSGPEVCEAMDCAVRSELASIPLKQIHKAFVGDRVPDLFSSDIGEQIQRLEAVREQCRGSAPGTAYIDCMVVSAINGESLNQAMQGAMAGCVYATLHSSKLSTIEHYKRKGYAADAVALSRRWDDALSKCDFTVHAQEAASTGKVQSGKRGSTQRSKIDQGPPI